MGLIKFNNPASVCERCDSLAGLGSNRWLVILKINGPIKPQRIESKCSKDSAVLDSKIIRKLRRFKKNRLDEEFSPRCAGCNIKLYEVKSLANFIVIT